MTSGAHKLVHSEPFRVHWCKLWQLLSALYSNMQKKFSYRCTSVFTTVYSNTPLQLMLMSDVYFTVYMMKDSIPAEFGSVFEQNCRCSLVMWAACLLSLSLVVCLLSRYEKCFHFQRLADSVTLSRPKIYMNSFVSKMKLVNNFTSENNS